MTQTEVLRVFLEVQIEIFTEDLKQIVRAPWNYQEIKDRKEFLAMCKESLARLDAAEAEEPAAPQ
jgi:hypothetical protein